jgi:hypothetical protein
MRNSITLLIVSLIVSSCFLMPLGAPHTHHSKSINPSNSLLKLKVFCTPHHKVYVISGTKESDSVYISASKMKKNKNHCLEKNFFGETSKSFSVRIGDFSFHRNLLNDTIKIEVAKPDLTKQTYKFMLQKDHHIKN